MHCVVDFHTHILPKIDDGSKSIEESLAMLRAEWQQGVKEVVLTPHFYPQMDDPYKFLERRQAAFQRLQEAMGEEQLPKLRLGAEVYYYNGMSNSEILKELAISGTKCILVEMPDSRWTERMYMELADIYNKQELIPVVAHIDRYIRPFHTYGIPQKLALLPVLVQASGDFFVKSKTRRLAMKLLKEDKIQLLGSDCHNMQSRPPALDKAVEAIVKGSGESAIQHINRLEQKVFSGSDFIL
jgi:protein-tyrosine phosphatase